MILNQFLYYIYTLFFFTGDSLMYLSTLILLYIIITRFTLKSKNKKLIRLVKEKDELIKKIKEELDNKSNEE